MAQQQNGGNPRDGGTGEFESWTRDIDRAVGEKLPGLSGVLDGLKNNAERLERAVEEAARKHPLYNPDTPPTVR